MKAKNFDRISFCTSFGTHNPRWWKVAASKAITVAAICDWKSDNVKEHLFLFGGKYASVDYENNLSATTGINSAAIEWVSVGKPTHSLNLWAVGSQMVQVIQVYLSLGELPNLGMLHT